MTNAKKLRPVTVSLTQSEIIDLLREACRRKYPELADEEFELVFKYNSYDYKVHATLHYYSSNSG